eukprot:gene18707-biopygen18982
MGVMGGGGGFRQRAGPAAISRRAGPRPPSSASFGRIGRPGVPGHGDSDRTLTHTSLTDPVASTPPPPAGSRGLRGAFKAWEKRQRTRTGRGAHDRIQRNGRGLDAGRAVSPSVGRGGAPLESLESLGSTVSPALARQ